MNESLEPHHQPDNIKLKKKKKKGNNPLARAREETRTQKLWHKKSGGGYILFIHYYEYLNRNYHLLPPLKEDGSHPSPQHEIDSNEEQTDSTEKNIQRSIKNTPQQRGESRASKRRRRKRKLDESSSNPPRVVNNRTLDADGDSDETKSVKNLSHHIPVCTNLSHHDQQQHRLLRVFEAIRNQLDESNAKQMSEFLETLASPLPLSFRIRGWLEPKKQSIIAAEVELKFGELLERMSLDDTHFVFQSKRNTVTSMNPSQRTALSKCTLDTDAPQLKAWLSEHLTFLARQELGSMLPVLLLSRGLGECGDGAWMGPGSRVLDLCASPGSKTLQALEVVGQSGKIKANDIHSSRLESLRGAVQRANPPYASRIKYTNLDARKFPIPPENKLFDTILCDVPCSGDGTIRKDGHILPNWTPQTSNALHPIQVRILARALKCLRVGGVMCYSTCSLNPVENEAVVAACLNMKGEFSAAELVDIPPLHDFNLRPGVSHWGVADYSHECHHQRDEEEDDEPTLRWYKTYQDAVQGNMEHAKPSLWPPENATRLGLEKCGRLWPQDHYCGGFFVAFIRRTPPPH
ncbi:hypothetical protein ACA910_010697 [Epithemia clementina (nom. ined.)]